MLAQKPSSLDTEEYTSYGTHIIEVKNGILKL